MHYANGREAKEGDFVIAKVNGKVLAGKLHALEPGRDACNANIAFPALNGVQSWVLTLGADVVHAEDAFNVCTGVHPDGGVIS